MNMKKLAAMLATLLLLHMSGVGWASAPESGITATEDIVIHDGETLNISTPLHIELGQYGIIIEPGGSINVRSGGWLYLTSTGEKPAIQSAGSLALEKTFITTTSITTPWNAIECGGDVTLYLCRVEGEIVAQSVVLDTCVVTPEPANLVSMIERNLSRIIVQFNPLRFEVGDDISWLGEEMDRVGVLTASNGDEEWENMTFTIDLSPVDITKAGHYNLKVQLAEPYASLNLVDPQNSGVVALDIVDPLIPYFYMITPEEDATLIFEFLGDPSTLTLWQSYDSGQNWSILDSSRVRYAFEMLHISTVAEDWNNPFLLVFEVDGLGYSEILFFEEDASGLKDGDRNGGDRMGSGMKLPSKDAENDGGAGAVFPPPPVVTPSPTPKPFPTYSPEPDWEPAPTPASTPSPKPSPSPSPTPAPPPVLPTPTPTITPEPAPTPEPTATTMPTSTPVPSSEKVPLPQPEATASPAPTPTPAKTPASSPEITAAPIPSTDSAEPPIPTHTPEPSVTLVPAQSVPPDITPSQPDTDNDDGSTSPPETEETPDGKTVLLIVILVTGIGIGTGFALIVGRRVVRPPK